MTAPNIFTAQKRRFAADGRPQGWFTELEATAYVDLIRRYPNGTVAEIGTWLGRSLSTIMPSVIELNLHLTSIDTWAGSDEAQTMTAITNGLNPYESFKANMEFLGYWGKFSINRKQSQEAAKDYPDKSFDIVMIDADHTYQAVHGDITAWLPKIKRGGLIIGHDYFRTTDKNPHPGVKQAVDELLGQVQNLGSLFWKEIQ